MPRTLVIDARRVRALVRGRGMGALNKQSGSAILGAGVSLAPVIAGAVSSTASVASATGLAPLLTAIGVSGPLAPFVAGAIVLALPVFKAIKALAAGCGETCIQTSQWANQASEALEGLKSKYFGQAKRTRSSQAATLQIIEELFSQLRALCSNPATGAAGQRCISERLVRGGTAPWCPNTGHTGCDWYALYYDPIANDPGVVDDTDPIVEKLFGNVSTSSLVLPGVLLGGTLLLLSAGND